MAISSKINQHMSAAYQLMHATMHMSVHFSEYRVHQFPKRNKNFRRVAGLQLAVENGRMCDGAVSNLMSRSGHKVFAVLAPTMAREQEENGNCGSPADESCA